MSDFGLFQQGEVCQCVSPKEFDFWLGKLDLSGLSDFAFGRVTEVGQCAFKNFKALKSMTFPDTVTSIGYSGHSAPSVEKN